MQEPYQTLNSSQLAGEQYNNQYANQLKELFSSLDNLNTSLRGAIVLATLGYNSDFEAQTEELQQDYWNVILDYLHQVQKYCDYLFADFEALL
jgi:hypothetical protein